MIIFNQVLLLLVSDHFLKPEMLRGFKWKLSPTKGLCYHHKISAFEWNNSFVEMKSKDIVGTRGSLFLRFLKKKKDNLNVIFQNEIIR